MVSERKPWEDLSYKKEPIAAFQNEYESTFKPPNFTYKELKECVPPALFERSTLKSLTYLAVNIVASAILFYLGTLIDVNLTGLVNLYAWGWYIPLQALALGGIWVLGHECGHGAFSPSKQVNDVIGFILHTSLLVPFFSWRISHALHHSSAANMAKDQVFVPARGPKSGGMGMIGVDLADNIDQKKLAWAEPWIHAFEESPIRPIIILSVASFIGWPLYLIMHFRGRPYEGFTSHFLPSCPLFTPGQRKQVIVSNVGLAIVCISLGFAVYMYSFLTVAKFYFLPYLMVNMGLVLVTLLHHTDVFVPHYPEENWSFVRGALATVDRSYGPLLNAALHHIGDTHVAHHLFPQMPHYNAVKATPYLKEKLGEYYLNDTTSFGKALWRIVSHCVYVEKEGDVLFYRRD